MSEEEVGKRRDGTRVESEVEVEVEVEVVVGKRIVPGRSDRNDARQHCNTGRVPDKDQVVYFLHRGAGE